VRGEGKESADRWAISEIIADAKFALADLLNLKTKAAYEHCVKSLNIEVLSPELVEQMKAAMYDWRTANGIV